MRTRNQTEREGSRLTTTEAMASTVRKAVAEELTRGASASERLPTMPFEKKMVWIIFNDLPALR